MKYKRKKNYWQRDIRKREYLQAVLTGSILIVLVSYMFYGTLWCTILFSPYLIWYIKSWEKQVIRKNQNNFRMQFKEAIQSLSTGLNVGYSVENALKEAVKELKGIYKKDDAILKELTYIVRQLQMNRSVEEVFSEFAKRTEEEDVQTFVTVFNMAKRSGGDTLDIIRQAVRQIGDKIDVEREIETILAAKKLELKIMSIIPFGMILYLKLSFPEFLDVLYGNVAGVVIMSICLLIYLFSYEMGKRIVEIEV